MIAFEFSPWCCLLPFRPLSVSTEDYGKMWLSFSHDTKQNLKLVGGGQEALGATLSVLERKLRLGVVEIIGEPMAMQLGAKLA